MFTIEDWKEGRCALKNDGTREQLEEFFEKAGISEGNFLRKSMKRHYIRTGNFPLVGQKFRLKSLPALSAEVDKVDILHLSLISGIWVEFKLTK